MTPTDAADRAGAEASERPDAAVRRLSMLASIFSGPTRAFLSQLRSLLGEEPCELALDLGCGAGHSTRLVAAALRPRRTIGLDSSPAALRAARSRTRNAAVSFVHHDVAATPFPGPEPDLVYSRFLLAHVPEPGHAVRRWAAQLRPGGKLVLDEGSSIRTSHEPIGRYLEMLGALLEHRGTAVDVGGILDDLGGEDQGKGVTLRCRLRREITFTPPVNGVAAMLRANMDVWRDDPFIVTHVGSAAVQWVQAGLEALARSPVRDGVAWDLRQVAFERA